MNSPFAHDQSLHHPNVRRPVCRLNLGWIPVLFIAVLNLACNSLAQNEGQQNHNQADQATQEDKGSTTEAADGSDEKETAKPKIPKGVDVYMGRRVARTMHFDGAQWLIRDEREREERCSLMLANLGVKPGMTVCDMGCGNGFHSLPIARMLADRGLVIGVDVQPEMLGFLRKRIESEGIENVIPILGSYHNPRLPPAAIDLVLMVDVYHEFSHPEEMLASIRKSLKPDGLVVLVEFRAEDENVPIKPLHKMSKAQVTKELTANGFKLVKEFDRLPWQHMMFFGIDSDKNKPAAGNQELDKLGVLRNSGGMVVNFADAQELLVVAWAIDRRYKGIDNLAIGRLQVDGL